MNSYGRSRSVVLRVLAAASIAVACTAAIVLAANDGDDPRAKRNAAEGERATGSWGSLASSPFERTEVGAARIGDRIYVVGGYISSAGTTGQMARYDISDDVWSEVAPLPIGVNHPGVTAHRGKLYVLGGNLPGGGDGEPKSARLYRYSPGTDRWARLPDAPSERAALALVGIGDRLYAAGGYTEEVFDLRTLEIYDLERRRWRRGPKMPSGRNHVGYAVLQGALVVTGGRPGPTHGSQATIESYDPDRRRWSTLAPMPTARSGHSAAVVSGRLVVLGGEELDGGQTIEQVEIYDADSNSWAPLPPMVTPRHGLGAAAKGKRIYALEGGPQPGLAYSSVLEYLDITE